MVRAQDYTIRKVALFLGLRRKPGNETRCQDPGWSLIFEFKLLISAALELAIQIRFQNASCDSCRISFVSLPNALAQGS